MAEFIEIPGAGLKSGEMKMVMGGGKEILIARVGDKYYAADNRCPHMGGDLSQGRLDGTIVTCPRHGSRFNLADGRNLRWTKWTGLTLAIIKLVKSPRPLHTYEVKAQPGKIMVAVGEITQAAPV